MSSEQPKRNFKLEKTSKFVKKITDLFVLLMLSVFPLMVFTDYKNITTVKYNTFIVLAICFIIFYIFEKGSVVLEGYIKKSDSKLYRIPLIFIGAFFFFNIISCLASPYFGLKNATGQSVFIFGSGRYDGMFVLALYILIFVAVSFDGSLKRVHINVLAGTTFAMCVIGIIQLLGYNALNFYPASAFTGKMTRFISTIGNIDVMSTFFCIALPMLALSYIVSFGNKKEQAVCCEVFLIGMFVFFEINVDSGKVAFIGLLAIALPVFMLNKERFLRLLDIVSITVVSKIISIAFVLKYHKKLQYTTVKFKLDTKLLYFIAAVAVIMIIRVLLSKFLSSKRLKLYAVAVIAAEVGFVIFAVVYLRNCTGLKSGMIYELSEILKGNPQESFGSYRYGLWKYSLQFAGEHKWFGTGIGTYQTGFNEYAKDLFKDYGTSTFDAAHNEYLQIFCNSGIFGIVTYLGFLVSLVICAAKKMLRTNSICILFFTMLCYLIQAFFTFSIVIVSPLFWLVAGLLLSECRKTKVR